MALHDNAKNIKGQIALIPREMRKALSNYHKIENAVKSGEISALLGTVRFLLNYRKYRFIPHLTMIGSRFFIEARDLKRYGFTEQHLGRMGVDNGSITAARLYEYINLRRTVTRHERELNESGAASSPNAATNNANYNKEW